MFDPDTLPDGPWTLGTPTPTTLILGAASSRVTESAAALAQCIANVTGSNVDLEIPQEDIGDALWAGIISLEELPVPLVCHPEPLPLEGSGLPEAAASSPGLVVQTLLHPGDPLTSLTNLLRLMTALDPDAAGVLDADTGRWFDRDMLVRELMESEVDPQADLLWVVTGVHTEDGHEVYTSGLTRCGRREIAVSNLDEEAVESAADMLGVVAALTLESPLPESGRDIEIGSGLSLHIAGDGGDEDAPVMLERSQGGGPPTEVLAAMSSGTAAVYRTMRDTARQRGLASETWQQFLDAIEPAMLAGGSCYVEVPWECVSGEDDRREHVWMEVVSRDQQHVLATPAHEGALVPEIPEEPGRIEVEDVCSWRVIIGDEVWMPEHVNQLRQRLAELA